VVVAQEIEFPVPSPQLHHVRVDPAVPELFFCGDLRGYGWCFRKGDVLNIGLGRNDAKNLVPHVRRFCQFLAESGKVGCEIPANFAGHAYRLYELARPTLTFDGGLLVGDAAGLAYPQSGEGIRPAVESGLLAADVISQVWDRVSRDDLHPYEQRVLARLGPPRAGGITGYLPAAWLRFLGVRLLATRWFSQHVVMDRWFLHAGQPALSGRLN
jgi:flavin-dependent dehydrogenase